MSDGGEDDDLPSAVLSELFELSQEDAIAVLRRGGWWNVSVAMTLAEWALERAEVDAAQAERALTLARLIAAESAAANYESPGLDGQIAYAEARRAVHMGDLATAETLLLRAQERWRLVDARGPFARTFLGLTQVLTMQGRYTEAALAAQDAIDALRPLAEIDPANRMLLARAYRNRANLLVYQEQHAAARDAYLQATAELEQFRTRLPPQEQLELEGEFGHLALNLASAQTFLDAPDEAEALLLEAVTRFERAQDSINRGRAQTNLGRLYLRLGEYAAALAAFDLATRDLIGDLAVDVASDSDLEVATLRQADELLLEHALAYLSLNLLPEAARALDRCERLFRATGQPYELAQSRYAQGVLWLQRGMWPDSQSALDEALALYTQLGNVFWRNRTQTARARLAQAQGDRAAATLLDGLLAAPAMVTPDGAVAWDLLGLVDVWLMRLQLWLDDGNVTEAEGAAQQVQNLLAGATVIDAAVASGLEETPLPHLALRLLHARGRIAAASGNDASARGFYTAAVELLDRQRAALPLEEVRTAYLDDKMAIYSDLVVSLLASPLPNEDEVAAAFAVVERARSRALLERLLASVESVAQDENTENESAEVSAQRAALRRQLHWLYNQLLGESGNRSMDGKLSRDVALHEAAIQQLEWRSAPLLSQAEPVRLVELQKALASDQQALVYYFAGNEVLAFVVGQEGARVVRRLASVDAVVRAQADLRFQLGRMEMGDDYVRRHQARLLRGVQGALHQLEQLLIAPLREHLTASRLLLIPYGALHLIPFHALWDGAGYWLEQVEITYVPSASIAVHKTRGIDDAPLLRFGGLAPYDERIPQAQAEIDAAATYFEAAQIYHREAATIANMTAAAASTDVLHLATHGLFRPDNSFFSAIKLADGWMDVREIYRLDLSARVVVLSACESGVGEVRGGDEVVGLARGFLAAGTQRLIASLWNVHDRSAAQLMDTFYCVLQADAKMRPAAALRAAQIKALRAGEHPYFWAPFFAIG
jgi:CHAT domain-containing protein/tetratricopeptide (TPR) repeat protein